MGRDGWGLAAGVALGVLIPWVILDGSAGDGRRALGLTAAPFGSARLLGAHLAFAAPLAMAMALAVAAATGRCHVRPPRPASAIAWAAVGLGVASVIGAAGPAIDGTLDAAGLGPTVLSLVRTTIAVLAVLPWMMPVAARWAAGASTAPIGWPAVAAAAVLATLPPAALADRLVDARLAELAEHLESGRLARARGPAELLVDLGAGGRELDGLTVARSLRGLRAELDRLARQARRPPPPDAPPEVALRHAFLLIRLDRLEEAEALLRGLGPAVPDAELLRAATLRDLGRLDDCIAQYRAVVDRWIGRAGADREALERCAIAFEGLAAASRAAGRPDRVEATLIEARRRLPDRAASFAAQLGRHYRDGGRPAAALAQFSEAVGLDPTLEASLAEAVRGVRVATPGCLLRRPAPGPDGRPRPPAPTRPR